MDKIGEQRYVDRFAWLPVTLTNGKRVWLQRYRLLEEYRRVHRYPLGVPAPQTLETMAAYSPDIEFASRCLADAADIRGGKKLWDDMWQCIEVCE